MNPLAKTKTRKKRLNDQSIENQMLRNASLIKIAEIKNQG